VELQFPDNLKGIHPVVSVQQIERALDPSTDPWGRGHPRPPAVDEEGEYSEAEIMGERTTKGGQKRYKVHWVGYPLDELYGPLLFAFFCT